MTTEINYNTKALTQEESMIMLYHFEKAINTLTDNYTKNINTYKEDMKLKQSLLQRTLQ
tara:strand:- start:59 stop:235 length:177 start_codon:yes stop_codon:yes gene_type:complete